LLEDKNFRGVWRKEVKVIIADFLFSLASKSENDLLRVESYLKEAEERFKDHYRDLSMLHLCRERILENFRDTNKGHSTWEETKRVLLKLKDCLF
jgi:hypothetical protein